MKTILVIWVIASLTVGCNIDSRTISERDLIGAWQVEVSAPKSLVFTYYPDHTYKMVLTGAKAGVKGRWRLEGDLLVEEMDSFGDARGGFPMPKTPYSISTNRILKLAADQMVVRVVGGLGHGGKSVLKRVASDEEHAN